jgi:hypothetical protein
MTCIDYTVPAVMQLVLSIGRESELSLTLGAKQVSLQQVPSRMTVKSKRQIALRVFNE